MIRLSDVILDCPEPKVLAAFYSELTGWPIVSGDEGWVTVKGDGPIALAFQSAPDHVPPRWKDPCRPQQFHLDFEVDEFEPARVRAEELGASFVEAHVGPRGYGWLVLTDPAGHPFCLCRNAPE